MVAVVAVVAAVVVVVVVVARTSSSLRRNAYNRSTVGVQVPFGFLAVCRGHPSKAAVGESSQATQRDLHTPGDALEQQEKK